MEKTRIKVGRSATPSYRIINSQSVRTTCEAEERGIDGEKTKGRKRHIVVDIMGNLLAVVVYAANIHYTQSGINSAKQAFKRHPTIKKFCADEGYSKSFENDVSEQLDLGVDISKRIKPELIFYQSAGSLNALSLG